MDGKLRIAVHSHSGIFICIYMCVPYNRNPECALKVLWT